MCVTVQRRQCSASEFDESSRSILSMEYPACDGLRSHWRLFADMELGFTADGCLGADDDNDGGSAGSADGGVRHARTHNSAQRERTSEQVPDGLENLVQLRGLYFGEFRARLLWSPQRKPNPGKGKREEVSAAERNHVAGRRPRTVDI